MGEFELIRRHFVRPAPAASAVALGVGDDCALLRPSPGHELAVSTDMLVEGRHFFADVDPAALGHKALAVNLSDLAAMGARPLGFTLALSLPRADDAWLSAFAGGLFALADAHACPLVGGDTTRGVGRSRRARASAFTGGGAQGSWRNCASARRASPVRPLR